MDAAQLDGYLLVGSVVVLLAVLAVRLSVRVGLPSLLLYLMMGVLLGEQFIGIRFDDADLAHALGFAALVVILLDGGITTKWLEIKPVLGWGLLLATAGVVVSVAIIAVPTHYAIGLGWQTSMLVGAIISATDAAAVFSVLRAVPLTHRMRGALEAESGTNDATTVLLAVVLSSHDPLQHGVAGFVGLLTYELVAGGLIGAVVGFGAAWVLRRVALPVSGLYPISVVAFGVLSYSGTAALHASGFAAVYVTALWMGNSELPHRAATRSFVDGFAWLAQIGLFIMLGLLASPSTFTWWQLGAGLFVGAVATLVARPVSVMVSALPFKVTVPEQIFVAWGGLRGAVPIVLATIPLSEGSPRATDVFGMIFVLVIILTLVQAPTLGPVARRLGVLEPHQARELDVEAAPMERIDADLLQVLVTGESRLHGVEVAELRLPPGSLISLVVRDGQSFTPQRTTSLRRGDQLLVVTPRAQREATERRLQDVSRAGRLARWNPGAPSV
jgi:cell volume regulation protein A